MKTSRDVIIRPVVSEKSYGGLERNTYTFLVDPRSNKTEIKEAIQKIWNVRVTSREHAEPQGQGEAPPLTQGKRRGPEARDRHPRRGRLHRDLRGEGSSHDRSQIQADHAGTPRRQRVRVRRDHAGHAREVARRQGCARRPVATTRAASPCGTRAAGTSDGTASSTSGATRTASRPRSRTIEYDPNRSARIALLHYADGEKRYILAPQGISVGDTLTSGRGVGHPARQRAAAAQHPRRDRRARGRAEARRRREDGSLGRQQHPARREGGRSSPRCGCPRARCGWSRPRARERSARSATPSTS